MNSEPCASEAEVAELKSLVRRIRTLAGVRRYGQPMGSIIKIDASPGASDRRKTPAPQTVDRIEHLSPDAGEVLRRAAAASTRDSLVWQPTEAEPFPVFRAVDMGIKTSPVGAITLSDFKITRIDLDDGGVMHDYRSDKYPFRFTVSKYDLGRRDLNVLNAYDREVEQRLGPGVTARPFYTAPITFDEPWHNDLLNLRDAFAASREEILVTRVTVESRFREQGYSLPWLEMGDEGELVSNLSVAERRKAAREHLNGMGVPMTQEEADRFSPPGIEVVAMAHEAMLDEFPLWNAFVDTYKVVETPPGVIAWNQGMPDDIERSMNVIGMSELYFGKDADPDEPLRMAVGGIATGHFSATGVDAIMENTGLGREHAALMHPLMHELGHTIGRSLTGFLVNPGLMATRRYARDGDKVRAVTDDMETVQADVEDVYEDFAAETQYMYQKYGLGPSNGSNDVEYTADAARAASRNKGWQFPLQPDENLRAHLSRYGTMSPDEMYAEVWAGYVLSDTPSQFVYEYGNSMREMFADLIEIPGIKKFLED